MNGDLFEGWLESVFVPCLESPLKSLLVIDNASHHRKGNIQEIADEYGFSSIFSRKRRTWTFSVFSLEKESSQTFSNISSFGTTRLLFLQDTRVIYIP